MSKRAVIYARVSTDMQRDNFSIPSQIAECRQFVQERNYVLVGDRFVDPETGRDTASGNGAIPAFVDDYSSRELSRPGLDSALQYLETVGFDVFVVHALDRLARDPYIRQTLEREIVARSAKVEFVLGNYEETPEGEVRKDLDATFAKWENAKRVERCNRGKRRKAESGQFVTGIKPFGYRRNPSALGGLEVDEKQAQIVRWIFEMYVNEGFSTSMIVRKLNEADAHSYNGKWAKTTLIRLLKNPVYAGRLYYNKTKLIGKQEREVRDQSEWIEIPTTPIIEEWLFNAAQKRFRENVAVKKRQPKRFYLLGGMIICGKCNRPYTAQTYGIGKQRRATELQTYRHRKKNGHCLNREIPSNRIEPIVWKQIVAILQDPLQLRRGYEESIEQQKIARERQISYLESLNKKKIKLQHSLMNLNAAYIDPELMMSKAEYIAQKTRIDGESKMLQRDIEAIEKDLAILPSPSDIESLEAFATQICNKLERFDPTPEEKRKILEMLHVKVIIDENERARLEGWFSPSGEDSGENMSTQEKSIGLLSRRS